MGDIRTPALGHGYPEHGVRYVSRPLKPPGSPGGVLTPPTSVEPSSSLGSVRDMLSELAASRLPRLERKLDDVLQLLAGQRKDLYTIDEIAELTGRSAYTVRRWVTEGKLTATRVAAGGPRGRLLIARAELDKLVASGKGACIPECAVNTATGGEQ